MAIQQVKQYWPYRHSQLTHGCGSTVIALWVEKCSHQEEVKELLSEIQQGGGDSLKVRSQPFTDRFKPHQCLKGKQQHEGNVTHDI